MLIPSLAIGLIAPPTSLSRRVNANSQRHFDAAQAADKLIKKGEC